MHCDVLHITTVRVASLVLDCNGVYVNDLCNVSTRLTSILFADDTSCLIEGTDLSDMCIQLSTEMNKLSTWLKTNRLSLNVSKTIA